MRLVCISDTHMAHKGFSIPDGNVLIHAGDATSSGTPDEVDRFLGWLAAQPHPHKILIAGNHDWLFQRDPDLARLLLEKHQGRGIHYLEDSGMEIEDVRFWGSPWQPWFLDWAFNLPRRGDRLREVWNRIPLDTDVLITHGPPFGILDQVHGGEHLGCEEMKIRLRAVKPRVHIFGHIHDGYGAAQSKVTTFINACTSTEAYQALNRPIVVDLSATGAIVHGIEVSPRKARLEKVAAMAEAAEAGPMQKAETWFPEAHLAAMKEMADLRGLSTESLIQNYALRGLHSDVAKHLRAEGKPGNRTVPFLRIDDEA